MSKKGVEPVIETTTTKRVTVSVPAFVIRDAVRQATGLAVPDTAAVQVYDTEAYGYFEIGLGTVRVTWEETSEETL